MFHGGDENFISCTHALPPEAAGHQIDGFRGAANKDYFLVVAGVQETLNRHAGIFVGPGGPLAELVDAAMNVGTVMAVEALFGFNHRQWFLAGGGIVEIDERLAMDRLVKNREILPHPLDVNGSGPFLMLAFAHGMMGGRHDLLGFERSVCQRFILASRDALSRLRSGLPWTVWSRTGKSFRTRSTSMGAGH